MRKLLDKKSFMKEMVYIQDDFEYYADKIEEFQNHKSNADELEIWRCNLFMELMKNLNIPSNRDLVRNTIVLILSLYHEEFAIQYDSLGKDTAELNAAEKIECVAILRNEFFAF